MKILKYITILLLIINVSCRKKELNNPLDNWFHDPPVSPVTQTIKTVIPVGYAASLVVMDMKGLYIPDTKSEKQKSAKILYVDTSVDYPYKFKGDTYEQMVIAYIQSDQNTALVSVFFTNMDIVSGSFKLQNVVVFPVVFDDEKVTAIYASMDINLGSNQDIGIDLTQEEIDESLKKLNNQRTIDKEGVSVAISQDAWIIDVYHNDTYDNLLDDEFKISGGQQAISAENYQVESSAGVLQMAMLNVDFSGDCLRNPTSGYVFMQDVEVATSSNNSEIVFGHVFYEFHPNCDGEILVDVATGNFIFAIGKEIDLGLN